jgi:hypoxanthine phosphoribosyltransferase
MNLFQKKEITLHSGDVSYFKIECDALTDGDIETLAYIISRKYTFYDVVGIPRGGIRIANALQKYASNSPLKILLIVDDVLTTGKSMEKAREMFGNVLSQGVVLFARGKCPKWVEPIFNMWKEKV